MAKRKVTVYSIYARKVSRIVNNIKYNFDSFEQACYREDVGPEQQGRILESKRYRSKIKRAEEYRNKRLIGDQRLLRYRK